jgi:hypothetical protein
VLKAVIENKNHTGNGHIDPNLMAEAVAIVRRRVATGTEQGVLRTVAQAILNRGGAMSRDESAVVAATDRLTLYGPSQDPRPVDPPERLDAIEAARVVFEETKAIRDTKMGVMVIARAENNRNPNARNAAAAKEAEQAYIDARSAMERASSVLTRRRNELEAWRLRQAVAASTAHNPRK